MTSSGKFLFFDTETNALGRMAKPVTQTLMQLAWVVTDLTGVVTLTQNRLVKGARSVGRYAPHGLTPDYVEVNGDEPAVVLAAFMKDVRDVVASGGCLVAHNADFDVGVLQHAGLDSLEAFCTMKNPEIMAYVGCRTTRGLKYPKLSELFVKLFGTQPSETLHDALGDTHVLRKCFHELLRLGVVEPPTQPDVFINASDVATLGGLMQKFNKHPYEVAERVLSRYGRAFGVTGRGTEVIRPAAETSETDVLTPVRTTTELGKRKQHMYAEVDSRGYDPEFAREAKRIIASKLACSLGTVQEQHAVRHHKLKENNARAYRLRLGIVENVTLGLVGRVDGFTDGTLTELKTRTRRLFKHVRDYERVQLEVYMRMVEVESSRLIETFDSAKCEHVVRRNDELWECLVADCMKFGVKLSKLVKLHWPEWADGDVETRKRIWMSC